MHIYEGVFAGTPHGQLTLLVGAGLTAIGTAVGLRKLDYERIPQVAVMGSAFFVASLIHVPVGPASVHLVLNGLLGLVLGWVAFPTILVALILQAVFFAFGGPATLGLNTFVMALPAVFCYYFFNPMVRSKHETVVFCAGFAAGAVAILSGAALTATALYLAGREFETFARTVLAVHIPSALIEGFITGSIVVMLRKVRPELLNAPMLSSITWEVSDAK